MAHFWQGLFWKTVFWKTLRTGDWLTGARARGYSLILLAICAGVVKTKSS